MRPEAKLSKPRPLNIGKGEEIACRITGSDGDIVNVKAWHREYDGTTGSQLVVSITTEAGKRSWPVVYLYGECELDDQRSVKERIEKEMS